MTNPSSFPAPTSAPLPTPGTVVPLPRDKPAPPALNLDTFQALTNKVQDAQAAAPILPPAVQTYVSRFWQALQAAEGAYNILATGYPGIWESTQYPLEHRQQKAAEFMDAVFTKQRADLDTAHTALKAAWDAVKAGLVPPMVGDSVTHELKLLNAREDVKLALEGMQPTERVNALEELFREAFDGNRDPGMSYLLAGTDFYKRVLRDEAARLDYADRQEGMVRQLLPTAAPFYAAMPEMKRLQGVLDLAEQVRGFTAMDNGIKLSNFLFAPLPDSAPPAQPAPPVVAQV